MTFNETTHSMSGIYRIIFDNQKSYIGLTNDLRRRMIEHLGKDMREHPELLISKALKKHKIQDIELLEQIDANDRQKLKEREQYWIAYYDTYKNSKKGYNMTAGGDGAIEGIYNISASLNQQQLDKVVDLLLNSQLTYEEIIDELDITIARSTLHNINFGIHYKNPELNYPLRSERIKKIGVENKTSKFYQNESLLNEIINLLKNSTMTLPEISQVYGISTSVLTLINTGKKYHQKDMEYPLRKKGHSQTRFFSQDEMNYIKQSLQSGQTMQDIASSLQCDRKVISDINCGRRQPQSNWNYPLKK